MSHDPHRFISYRSAVILTLICSVIMAFCPIINQDLASGDETRVAGISAAMNIDHDYIIPKLNGKNFLEYPPLYYWCTALSLKTFGNADFAAKLPAGFFAVGCALLLLFIAEKLNYPAWAALLCSLILSSSPQFFVNSHKCMVDISLVFFFMLSAGAFWGIENASSPAKKGLYLLLGVVGISGGILAKGLIGVVFPVAFLSVYLILGDILINRSWCWKKYLFLTLFFLLGIAGASWWYYLVFCRCGGDALYEVTIQQNFSRFSGEKSDHSQNIFFYLGYLPTMFQPYLIFVFAGLFLALKNCRKKLSALFLASFLLIPFLLLCITANKRVVYLLPLSVPCALLCGYFFINAPEKVKVFLGKVRNNLPGFLQCRTLVQVSGTIALLLGILILANGIWNYRSGNEDSLRELFRECRKLEKSGYQIKLSWNIERTAGACVFYLGKTVPTVNSKELCPPQGEVWIARSRKPIPGALKFRDRHYLMFGAKPEMSLKKADFCD